MERSPQVFFRLQGVWNTYCKKNTNGKMPATPEVRCKHMGVETASLTNPEKGRADKRKLNR